MFILHKYFVWSAVCSPQLTNPGKKTRAIVNPPTNECPSRINFPPFAKSLPMSRTRRPTSRIITRHRKRKLTWISGRSLLLFQNNNHYKTCHDLERGARFHISHHFIVFVWSQYYGANIEQQTMNNKQWLAPEPRSQAKD